MSAWLLAAPSLQAVAQAPTPGYKGTDVMASVDGRTITRRELTYFWVSIDRSAAESVGELLTERWRAAKGSLPAYTIPDTAIYAQLYGGKPAANSKPPPYTDVLTTLVANRLVEIEAGRKHIVVTPQEVRDAAHELFDQVRKRQGLKMTDEQMITSFHVPRDIFMEDMIYRLRLERLIAGDTVQRTGHPLTAEERANLKQTAEQKKPEYLSRLIHSAHIKSVVPLPDPMDTPPQNGAAAQTPPPPPDVKQ
jgi:hypothetical protein